MKKNLFLSSLFLSVHLSFGNVVISNFGTEIENDLIGDNWPNGYLSATSVLNSNVGIGDGISDFTNPFVGDLTGLTDLQLIANVNAIPSTDGFTINLYDAEGDTASASFNWSSFISGPQTVLATLTYSNDFDPADTALGWDLTPTGIGGSVDVQFTSLTAVPEPSTYAALTGLLALGYVMVRRRRT